MTFITTYCCIPSQNLHSEFTINLKNEIHHGTLTNTKPPNFITSYNKFMGESI